MYLMEIRSELSSRVPPKLPAELIANARARMSEAAELTGLKAEG